MVEGLCQKSRLKFDSRPAKFISMEAGTTGSGDTKKPSPAAACSGGASAAPAPTPPGCFAGLRFVVTGEFGMMFSRETAEQHIKDKVGQTWTRTRAPLPNLVHTPCSCEWTTFYN